MIIQTAPAGQPRLAIMMYEHTALSNNLPRLTVSTHSTPSAHTPMGVKGCGEVGTIGSPAAVTNAVVDALSHYGVSHIDMPTTPNSIWCLIRKGALPQPAK